jgi:hypothetical protein
VQNDWFLFRRDKFFLIAVLLVANQSCGQAVDKSVFLFQPRLPPVSALFSALSILAFSAPIFSVSALQLSFSAPPPEVVLSRGEWSTVGQFFFFSHISQNNRPILFFLHFMYFPL